MHGALGMQLASAHASMRACLLPCVVVCMQTLKRPCTSMLILSSATPPCIPCGSCPPAERSDYMLRPCIVVPSHPYQPQTLTTNAHPTSPSPDPAPPPHIPIHLPGPLQPLRRRELHPVARRARGHRPLRPLRPALPQDEDAAKAQAPLPGCRLPGLPPLRHPLLPPMEGRPAGSFRVM